MTDFIEHCVADENANLFTSDGFDEQKAINKALCTVLPLIMENELTDKQARCMREFYVLKKTQKEIARDMGLSQPTVNRHIATARQLTNKLLGYCCLAVSNATSSLINSEYM